MGINYPMKFNMLNSSTIANQNITIELPDGFLSIIVLVLGQIYYFLP